MPITASTGLVLQAFPSALGGGSGTVNLLLTDGSGNPVSGAQIQGTCTGGPGINGAIAPTGANGRTTANITAGGLRPVCPGEHA